jgi:hypothetical protein
LLIAMRAASCCNDATGFGENRRDPRRQLFTALTCIARALTCGGYPAFSVIKMSFPQRAYRASDGEEFEFLKIVAVRTRVLR